MVYKAPELSLDVVLVQQSGTPHDLSAEVALCSPVIDATLIAIDSVIVVTSYLVQTLLEQHQM